MKLHTHAPRRRLRLTWTGLCAVVCVVGSLLLVPSSAPAAPAPSSAAASAAYDARVSASDCDLLGREYAAGRGCARSTCVEGAVPFRKVYGAEACALRGQPRGYGFVATVDVRQCQALHRRWIASVNYCASDPDRSVTAVYGAPQCVRPASVYVNLAEQEGYYDECLTPEAADALTTLAGERGTTLADEVASRSGVQCAHRPSHVFSGGLCVADPSLVPSGGGVVVIGDSLTWRGGDELTRLRPSFVIDGEPARPATELAPRLAFFRALHGEPDGLVIELGTVGSPGFGRRDLLRVVRSLPARTRLMLVQPHYEVRTDPVVVSPQSTRVGRWMRQLAASRPRTCAADWPAYVRSHPGILQDGVHTRHDQEGRWARWLSRAWSRC